MNSCSFKATLILEGTSSQFAIFFNSITLLCKYVYRVQHQHLFHRGTQRWDAMMHFIQKTFIFLHSDPFRNGI